MTKKAAQNLSWLRRVKQILTKALAGNRDVLFDE
jgi:hypothetical protein